MNLREGKMGRQETASLLCIAMTVSGIFSINSKEAYSSGNSTYVSIPVAIVLSALVFLLVCFTLKKCGQQGILKLTRYVFGTVGEIIYSVILVVALIAAAYIPTDNFLVVMRNYLYLDSDYSSIVIFIVPVIAILAFIGFEGLGRTAKIVSWALLFGLILMLIKVSGSLEAYRLAPILGDGMGHMTKFSLNSISLFLPSLLLILALTNGTQGYKNARSSGLIAAGVAFLLCFGVQLIIGMAFTYSELKDAFMPLYVITSVPETGVYFMRLEKLAVFMYLAAALVAAGYYVYGAANVFAKGFKQHDIRPAIASMSAILLLLIIATHNSTHAIKTFLDASSEYFSIMLLAPTVVICAAALIKSFASGRKKSNAS